MNGSDAREIVETDLEEYVVLNDTKYSKLGLVRKVAKANLPGIGSAALTIKAGMTKTNSLIVTHPLYQAWAAPVSSLSMASIVPIGQGVLPASPEWSQVVTTFPGAIGPQMADALALVGDGVELRLSLH